MMEDPAGVDDGQGNEVGQCVSLVKRLCSNMVGTTTAMWIKGDPVKGAKLAPGTVIATFLAPGNKYKGHAAIYIRQDNEGIWVWDQYHDKSSKSGMKRVGVSHIRFRNQKPHYNGDNFFVVK
jgi:phage-related protein